MNPNIKIAEKVAVVEVMNPASVAASTVVSAWVPMANLNSLMALITTGVLGTSATLDAKLRQATDSSGTGAKDITGKAIVQIVKALGDNKQATIECRDTELDVNNGFTHVALSVTIGTAASIFGAVLLGGNPRYVTVANLNHANLVQQIG